MKREHSREEWNEIKKARKLEQERRDALFDGRILIRYGEIALKGDNRSFFENTLVKNIRRHLEDVIKSDFEISRVHGRFYLSYEKADEEKIVEELKHVFGIVSFSVADRSSLEFEDIAETAIASMREILKKKGYSDEKDAPKRLSFKVEANRGNKSYQYTSPEICKHIGAMLLKNVGGIYVDVHQPEITVHVDVRERAYVYTDIHYGPAGMPYGSSAKAMVLISGGIDSPVAAYLMAKRGVKLEFVHFHSYPFTSDRAMEKVKNLVKQVSKYTGSVRLHNVNLLEIQKAIMEHCPEQEMTILSRRFMMKIAAKIAKNRRINALVTGESVGQVASQTIESLNVTNSSMDLMVLRPLIAMDKVDIVKIAKQIGTYETSIEPFEDCCTVFLPDHVVTKPRVDKIVESENKLAKNQLIYNAIGNMEIETISYHEAEEY